MTKRYMVLAPLMYAQFYSLLAWVMMIHYISLLLHECMSEWFTAKPWTTFIEKTVSVLMHLDHC